MRFVSSRLFSSFVRKKRSKRKQNKKEKTVDSGLDQLSFSMEQKANQVIDIEDFDVVHSVSARQRNSKDTRSDEKSQGKNPPTNIFATINIA